MARQARTASVSMGPQDRDRWERLKGERKTSDFVRGLLDHEEQRRARRERDLALELVQRVQEELPESWTREDAWDFQAPDESGVPDALRAASIDMTGPGEHGYPIGPA